MRDISLVMVVVFAWTTIAPAAVLADPAMPNEPTAVAQNRADEEYRTDYEQDDSNYQQRRSSRYDNRRYRSSARDVRAQYRYDRNEEKKLMYIGRFLEIPADEVALLMDEDPDFEHLANNMYNGWSARRRSAKGLVISGAVILGLSLLIGGAVYGAAQENINNYEEDYSYYDSSDSHARRGAGIGLMAAGGTLGLLLLIPGIVVFSVKSGGEKELMEYWQSGGPSLAPDAMRDIPVYRGPKVAMTPPAGQMMFQLGSFSF